MARIEIDVARRAGAFTLEASFASEAPVTALFGRSGCGKSTILNLVAGLARPDRGRIAIGERVLFDSAAGIDLRPEARRVGYVFQDGLLLPHLSVRQNIRYGRFFTPTVERWADEDRIVELLDLQRLLERRPHHLSGGEKQRVAIARALLASPRLLLMDEPLASLDAGRRGEILYYIERLRDDVGIPILYVSHEIEEVTRLAGHMVLLSEGRVAASGTVPDLMGRLDLRRLIGRYEGGAVIEVRVAAHDLEMGLAELRFAGGTLYAPDVEALVGETLRIRVRARDVSLALSRPVDASFLNVLEGTIGAIGTGEGASIDVRLDVGGTPLIARITRRSVAALGLAPGKRAYALIKAVAVDRHSVGYA